MAGASGARAGAGRGAARGQTMPGVVRELLSQSGIEVERVERARQASETVREVGEQALHAVRKWADPRERELRRRRRFRRRTLRLGAASGITALGTAGLVILSAPAWAVVVVAGGAAALVTGAAVSTRRYLALKRNPLPQAAFVPAKLPPVRSAARAPISRLIRAERALHTLGTQIARHGRLPADDLTDTLETAGSGAAALHALAADVTAMEQAIGLVGQSYSTPDLTTRVAVVVARLDSGVDEYELLVAAAGRILAAPHDPAIPDHLGWALTDLRDAADRLDGWAHALAELADRNRPPIR
ncbi:phage shock envelope stress response protein PspM [Nocardia sp. BMG111209]|uniref:phage shock envelope stress response protein PspM n=1 Tax=Nocardia sp. BMG111209 TaxID=1160137 RepID=UPI001E438A01|nr:hypothetical protein [Nocardia sp. BMG111209]